MLARLITVFSCSAGLALSACTTTHKVFEVQTRQREGLIRDFVARQKTVDINGTCATATPTAAPAIRDEVESLVKRFAHAQARKTDPDGYISAMDRIIQLTGYGFLLACRDMWRGRQPYRTEFFDYTRRGHTMGPMSVGDEITHAPDGTVVHTLKMRVELHSPVQLVMFAYMHELMHICQKERSDSLYAARIAHQADGTVTQIVDLNHDSYLIELEAHALMPIAYADFVKYSRTFCLLDRDEPPPPDRNYPWHQLYAIDADEIYSGQFPLRVIADYSLDKIPDSRFGVFADETPETSHPKSLVGNEFKIRCLDPGMKKAIEQLGLPVNEGPSCPR